MCTATWWMDAGRYELFFSRDERRDRAEGLPPRLRVCEGVEYLCPRDPDGGGTWLLVNAFGLSVALLNQYPDDPAPRSVERVSRGQLVESLATCREHAEVARRLFAMDLEPYDGFLLLAIGTDGACRMRWDTHLLELTDSEDIEQPLSSSSYMTDEVLATRRHLFADMVSAGGDPSPEQLNAFHRHFIPEASTHSVFMQRGDSETVSLCHVVVTAERIWMTYAPKAPGLARFQKECRVELRSSARC